MRYIKLFEKYSLPNSVDFLSKEVIDFVYDRFSKWFSRKSLANYSEVHNYTPKFFSDDFPVKNIKINTIFIKSDKYGDFNTSGGSTTFDEEDGKIKSKILKSGNINIGIIVKIYVSNKINSINNDELFKDIENLIIHELLHSFQSYKVKSKNIIESKDFLAFSWSIVRLMELLWQCKEVVHFLTIVYISYSKYETDAYLSQLWSKNGRDWIDYLEYADISYDELTNIIKDELKDSPGVYDDLYKHFMNLYNKFCDEYNVNVSQKNNKINFKSTEEFIKFLHNLISNKKDYLRKKIGKIKANKDYED